MHLNLGVTSLSAEKEGDLRSALRWARETGFAAIQLESRGSAVDVTGLSETGRREILALLRSHDLKLSGLSADLGRKGFGQDIEAVVDWLDPVLESAAALLSPLVCLDPGPLPPKDALDELGRRADQYGVQVALRNELTSFADFDKSLRLAACPWFGIDFDPVAALVDPWNLDEIFSRKGEQLLHLRGRDAILGSERRTKPAVVGNGSVDWPALLKKLDAASYTGWITLDAQQAADRRGAAAAGLTFLRDLIK
jgi:sugar phosphate isomerase/epimerase